MHFHGIYRTVQSPRLQVYTMGVHGMPNRSRMGKKVNVLTLKETKRSRRGLFLANKRKKFSSRRTEGQAIAWRRYTIILF